MYEAFYGLRERPFNLTPDPRFLYLSEKHKEAFAHLLYGIKNRSGFVMVTGEIGTGKTTICRNLLNQLDDDTEVAFIFNPSLNVVELLERIHSEFGIESRAQNALGLVDELNAYLLEKAAEGKNCVLVIDEAQNLSPQVLEQIRLLSNLETERDKLLQIILIGQPELGEMLQLHELRQLNQRITARYHLKPLSQRETLQYIAYRLHVAGAKRRVKFDKAAIRAVYRYSGGTPRVINALCDRAMLIGYTRENYEITRGLIRQAAREIKGERHRARKPGASVFFGLGRLVPSSTVVFAVIMTLALAVFFAQPLERFTREFSVFNSIVGDNRPAGTDSREPADVPSAPQASAVVAEIEPAGPVSEAILKLARESRMRPSDISESEVVSISPDPAMARAAAVGAILDLWERPSNGLLPADDSPAALRAFLKDHGLTEEAIESTAEALFTINLPFFARMKDGESEWWSAVLERQEGRVRLSDLGDGPEAVSQEEFARLFTGEAIVPWLDTNPQARVLKPEMTSDEVAGFRQQLHRLGRIDKGTGRKYDASVQAAVRTLQQDTGLDVDGIAGRQVRMVLASWLQEDVPHLQPQAVPVMPEVQQAASLEEPDKPSESTPRRRPKRDNAASPQTAPDESVPDAPATVSSAPAPSAIADALPDTSAESGQSTLPAGDDSEVVPVAADELLPGVTMPAAEARPMFWLGANPGESNSAQFGTLPPSEEQALTPAGASDREMPPAAQPLEDRKRSTAPALSGVPIVPREPDETSDQP
jgi:general secretion pathway protein A